jgi:hypothetical protein
VLGPLDFNMLLGRDYVHAMKAVVSTLFCMMNFPHNISIIIIDHLSPDNHHPSSISAQFSPLCVPSVRLDSSLPQVNYVASYPPCSIASEKVSLQLCSPSRGKVSTIDQVLYPMGEFNPFLSNIGLSNLLFPLEFDLTVCETLSPSIYVLSSPVFMDVELPLYKVILEAMIMDL